VVECDSPEKNDEVRMEEGMSCFIPKVCPALYQDLVGCMSQHGDLEKCIQPAQKVMGCWGEWCVRMYKEASPPADHQ